MKNLYFYNKVLVNNIDFVVFSCLMKYLFLLLFFPLFQSTAQETEPVYEVHCDCEHIVAYFGGGTEEEAQETCSELTSDLQETNLGGVGVSCGDEGCTCLFSHSVYASGQDLDSAIENAISACADVAILTSKEFAITSIDSCKVE